jgi:predicted dehydrogenase
MARIAVISAAHIHARGFLQTFHSAGDGRKAHVLWDEDRERGMSIAREFSVRYEPELGKVLADSEVEGFLVCSETARHLELLMRLLPLGKPVLCDKPLVTARRELTLLRRLVERHPGRLITGYFMPHFGDHRAIHNLLRGGFFGKITRSRFRSAHAAAYARWFDAPELAWFTDPQMAGGGGFLDMGTHGVHLLLHLFGPVREVLAEIRNEAGIYPEVDDFGIAHLRFDGGLLGTVEGGWTQTGGPRQLEISGSDKSLWHDGSGYLIEGPSFARENLYTIPNAPSRVDRLVAAVRGQLTREELEAEVATALEAVAVMEACYKSAAKGRWVKLTEAD